MNTTLTVYVEKGKDWATFDKGLGTEPYRLLKRHMRRRPDRRPPNAPFTNVVVENLTNGLSVTVRVNDRGPSAAGMMLDLSRGAAEQIGIDR